MHAARNRGSDESKRFARIVLLALVLGAAAKAQAQQANYEGLGAHSVAPELIAKFAPPALDPAVARRIQAMLDVQAPGIGFVAPGGKRIFFGWRITGSPQVFRMDAPQGFAVQMSAGEDRTTVHAVTPDGKLLVVSRDEDGTENPGLYLQSSAGGTLRTVQKIDKVRTLFDFVSDDGKELYFHSNDLAADGYAIYRYDIATATRSLVFAQKGLWSIADHRVSQGELHLLLERATGSFAREYAEYVPASGRFSPLLGAGEAVEYEAMYAAQPGELLVRTNRFSEFRQLYRWRMGTEPTQANFHPVLAGQAMDVAGFAIDPPRRRVYANLNDGGYLRLKVLDARSFAAIDLPLPKDAEQVLAGRPTPDGRFVALRSESAQDPGTGYVWDWQTRRLTLWLAPSAPEIDLARFAPVHLQHYAARDGTKIPMFVRFPKGCAPEEDPQADPCPVVVRFHGGPEAQARPGFSASAQLFIDAGFILVEPNVRGSDGYGKAWLDADNGPKRLDVISDIDDAGKWVRANWTRNGKAPRVGVTGNSYGGYATLLAMTLFAGTFDAGASVVGMSNLQTFLRNTAPYRRLLRVSEYGDPDKDAEVLRKLSPITYIERLRGPLLLIQGINDPRVPVGEAVQMHELLEARGIVAPLILFADEGHGAAKRSNLVQQFGQVLQFFEQNLRPTPPR